MATRAHRATLRVPTFDGHGLVLIASAGAESPPIPEVRTDPSDAGVMTFRSNEMIVVNDYSSYTTPLQSGFDKEIRSQVYLPVRNNKAVLGVLSIASKQPNAFKPEITAVLEAYALALGELIQSIAAEQALRESESKYRTLVNQSPDMVFVSRIDDFRLVEMNDRACEHYGYSREEFLGLEIFDLEIEPPLRQQVKALYESTPVGQDVEVYGTNKRKDGTTFPVHVRFAKLDDVFAIANVRDITEAKHAENILRDSQANSDALFEDAPHGIIVVDDAGFITRVNSRLEKYFGYTREELVGSGMEMLLPESSRAKHFTLRAGYIEEPVSRSMGEGLRLMGRRKDGSEFPVEIGLSTVDTSDGHLTIAHVSDDTLRRESEELQRTIEARLSDELDAREAEMALADQVASILTSTLDINQVFTDFSEALRDLVEFNHATIIEIDPESETIAVSRYQRIGPLEDIPQTIWKLKGSQTEEVMRTGRTIIRDELSGPVKFDTDVNLTSLGLHSTIFTPLVYNDRVIGSISLASTTPNAFGPREQAIMERLARQIAPAVENARLYDESVSRTAELKCLVNLAEILGQTISFEEKIHQVLEQLVEVADGFSAHFRVPTATGEELVLAALALIPGDHDYSWPERLGEGSLSFEAFRQGRPLVVDDYKSHPDANPLLAQTEIRSTVYVPVMAGGQAAALVTVNSKELDHFTPDRVRLLTAIGEGLGTLLENSQLSEELRSTTEEMELVDEVAKIITSTLDIEQEYGRFALEVKKLVDFDRATLLDVDWSTNSYAIRSTWGIEIPSLRSGTNIPLEGSSLQRTLKSDERILVEELAPPFKSTAYPSLFEAGLRSHMMVPLIFNDQITGGIAMLSFRKGAFGDREQRIMQRMASQIAPAVENARLFRQAQERTQEIERLHESTNRILDSNPSALVVVRGVHREVVTVNSSFRAAFRPDQNQIEGQPLSRVLDWVELEECIRESIASPLGEGQTESVYRDHDGTERWFSVSVAPLVLENDTGEGEEILLILNDITEQKQHQERFQEQARLASVGQLASGVAHEINNPLAAIHGYSELLQSADLPPQATEDARMIQSAAERAAKIVQNLLSFARKSVPEKRYLNVASVVDQAMALKARDFELENIRVTTKHSKDIPPTMVDEQQIIQVMLNILTNAEQAIKAGRGHGEITIATRQVKGVIRIRVSDDGPGIPAEYLHSIFDPFFTTKEVGEGTGLGLSICYGIVRDHGGKMWAESALGKGAAFHIELPVLSNVVPAETQSAETDGVKITARCILVVDDEPEVRNILGRVLSADGHDVSLAADGQEAWELIQIIRFDSIFLDLRMPGVDGQDLYQQIVEYSPDLARKVVFITGDSARADTERFLESTSSPVLGKPFTIEAIRQLL